MSWGVELWVSERRISVGNAVHGRQCVWLYGVAFLCFVFRSVWCFCPRTSRAHALSVSTVRVSLHCFTQKRKKKIKWQITTNCRIAMSYRVAWIACLHSGPTVQVGLNLGVGGGIPILVKCNWRTLTIARLNTCPRGCIITRISVENADTARSIYIADIVRCLWDCWLALSIYFTVKWIEDFFLLFCCFFSIFLVDLHTVLWRSKRKIDDRKKTAAN